MWAMGWPARGNCDCRNWVFVRRSAGGLSEVPEPGRGPRTYRSYLGHGRTPRKLTVQRRSNPVGATTARSRDFGEFPMISPGRIEPSEHPRIALNYPPPWQ